MDTRQTFTAQMNSECESWKVALESAPLEALLVVGVAVIEVLADKHEIKIVLS